MTGNCPRPIRSFGFDLIRHTACATFPIGEGLDRTAGVFIREDGLLAGADCLKQLGFRALRNYFMHSCLVRKNPCLSVASLDFFDDILKAENSFSNETGRQATAPDR